MSSTVQFFVRNDEIKKLYDYRNKTVMDNLLQMIKDRGYIVESSFGDNKGKTFYKENGDSLFVFIFGDENGMEIVKEFSKNFQDHVTETIILMNQPLSSKADSTLKEIMMPYNFQIFLKEELYIRPPDHFLVPKHIEMTQDEKAVFLKENPNINPANLPMIKKTDAVVKYYNWKLGTIVKIERESIFSEFIVRKSYYYRIVVD